MFRVNSGAVWQANQCFQLFIGSPYQDATIYQSFWNSQPPVCTSLTPGVTVSCSIAQQDTLSIVFPTITTQSASNQAIQIVISNFHTPFSSQILKTLNIRSYSDQNCQVNMKTTQVPSVTIQQATLPASNVNLTTSSNVIGVSTSSNTLNVNFTPSATMSLSSAGAIDIGVPYWYQIGNTGERMYSATAQKKCSSNCFRVLTSGLVNDHISITYDSMLSSCFGQIIQIQCRQFYNPISPILTPGFSITTYDSEIDQRIIEQTQAVVYLDARYYLPNAIPNTNFVINPSNNAVATFSQWTLSLTVNIPMRQKCYIRFYLPPDLIYNPISIVASGIFIKPDLDPNLKPADLQVIYKTADGSIPKSSIIFEGCNDLPSLGKTPFGRIDIQNIQTQNAIKNSSTFDITIYNDAALTQVIAYVQDGAYLAGSLLTPGIITNMSITPSINRVQAVNNLKVTFKITNKLDAQAAISVRLPQGLSIPLVQNNTQATLQVQLSDGTFRNATILQSNEIQVPNIVLTNGAPIIGGSTVQFVIMGVQNQVSAKEAGDYRITTFNMFNNTLYVVDQSTATYSYNVTYGAITAVGQVQIDNPTNAASLSTYTLNFNLQDSLIPSGFLIVKMPPELVLNPSSTQSSGSCKTYFCSYVDNQTVSFLIQHGLPANQTHQVVIGGVQNPRSFKPTANITLTTIDVDGVTLIDSGFNKSAVMTIPGLINGFTITPSSVVNGALNTYTFSAQAVIPFVIGDKITITLPQEIKAPTSIAAMNCKPVVNIISMNCTIQGQTIIVQLLNFTNNKQQLTWNISGITNAPSTQPATQFTNVFFVDSFGYVVNSVNNQSSPTVTNSQAATLLSYSLLQADLTNGAVTQYDITFTPTNAIPSTASLAITYPFQISLSMGVNTQCIVKTYVGTYSSNCAINLDARLITISNVFASNPTYSGPVTVTLAGVVNPVNNKPGNGFIIQVYKDPNQIYIQDQLVGNALQPKSPCNYPCNTCSSLTKQDNCQTCWQTPNDPQFLTSYANGTSTCKNSCDLGSTTNGNPSKTCQACDPSCLTCYDNGVVGDYNQCIDCASAYPFRLAQTFTCMQNCAPGMFATTNNTCAMCRSPCQTCFGSQDSCTYCFQNSSLPQLYKNSCIDKCPVGYISLNGICTKCRSPCAQCSGTVDSCLTCDGSGGTKFIYQQKCWATCPAGSGPDPDQLTCFPCSKGCDLCDITNKTQCLKCTPPSVVYNHGCVDKCPEGWHVNYPDGDGTACRLWKLQDAGLIPFPFLILAFIFSVVCVVGLMKKRAYLFQNKMKLESPQHTLTCIIVAIAPLQFIAVICQWLLAYVYGTVIFAILPLIVTAVAVIINVFFSTSFHRHFNSKVVPLDYERRVRLGKITRQQANKHQIPCDESFHAFKQEHACTVTTIQVVQTLLNFKVNKALYSFFYDQPKFQARFTHAKFYRKMMTTYYVIWLLCIDIALIVIDITTLVMIEGNNQFWVTVIETLVLSILSVILGSFELWHLKKLLAYTETPKDKARLNEAMKDEWSDKDLDEKFNKEKMTQRRILMGDLLKNVKHNKQLFLNNKLDELLSAFGNRKCSSMMDLGTGWNLEDDPRMVITWPISPMLIEDYEEMGEIKFSKEDAYGLQGNNVYADAKSKFMGMDFGTQNDEGYLEFQDALNRKHGGLLFEELGDLEERRMKRKKRRRGRKNKYYAQIDHEDDQEAEMAEASDTQDNLPMIAELEEKHEKQMRMAVQAEQQKQKEQALLRKKAQEEMQIEKQKREQSELIARQNKNKELELRLLKEQEKEQEKLRQQTLASKKLQDEFKKEEADRKERERLQQQQANEEAAKLRQEYQYQEDKRKKELQEQANQMALKEDQEMKLKMQEQQRERDLIIQQQEAMQALKDQQDFEQNRKLNSIKAQQIPSEDIEIPPNSKTFNEYDILGDLDRDLKGNLILLTDQSGKYHDKEGKSTNQKGYLLDPATGNVVENQQFRVMFTHDEMFQNGEVPSPFNVEKHNFNPHNLMGDFDFVDGKPSLMQSKQGFYMDKKGRRVNRFGWMVLAGQGHLVDIHGRKKFDKTQLTTDGDLQKLLNYQGKQFDIKQVMGQFIKDKVGNILLSQKPNGELIDLLGRRVTNKGYLCDALGNIIDTQNRVLWQAHELTNGEFIKIFPYTTFDISRIQDTNSKQINSKGYLIDAHGNVVDTRGQIVFEQKLLNKDGDIPAVFRGGNVQVDVNSDMSGLMAQIEAQGESSRDSQDDSPDNYDAYINNELGGDQQESVSKRKRNKKKKSQITTVEVLQPTGRERNMADAYGGQAIGQIRRPGVKYEKERLVGKKVFKVNTAEEPKLRAKLAQLVKSSSGVNLFNQDHPASATASKNNGFMGQTQRAIEPEVLSPKSYADSVAQVEGVRGQRQQNVGAKDFEEIFGKDIDQFLEDSDWDSKSGGNEKLETMEQQFQIAPPK